MKSKAYVTEQGRGTLSDEGSISLANSKLTRQLKHSIFSTVTEEELELISILEKNRPKPLRDFDQIPMRGTDLLFQIKTVLPHLAGKEVVFVGDYDSSSLLIGLTCSYGFAAAPKRMTLVDFDERLLKSASELAKEYGFSALLETRPYNVFDPIPSDLRRKFDIFYTNPPYGASNMGESARLFINRGCDFVKEDRARGYVLIPNDSDRYWTREAMYNTQYFMLRHGWRVETLMNKMHRYALDDDETLMSSLLIVEKEVAYTSEHVLPRMPFSDRKVPYREIEYFYGKSVLPGYPWLITEDGREIQKVDTLQ